MLSTKSLYPVSRVCRLGRCAQKLRRWAGFAEEPSRVDFCQSRAESARCIQTHSPALLNPVVDKQHPPFRTSEQAGLTP